MQTDIHYRDITRTETLETFLLDKIEGLVEKFMTDDPDTHLSVRVETERHRMEGRKPVFICEVILKPTHSKRILKVRKTNEDFALCVAETAEALKTILRRRSDRESTSRRRSLAAEALLPAPANTASEDEFETTMITTT